MARKSEIDPRVKALVDSKQLITKIRSLSDAFLIHGSTIFLKPDSDIHEEIITLNTIPMKEIGEIFNGYLFNAVEASAFNKALKKTKTVVEEIADQGLKFSTDGYEETLTLVHMADAKDLNALHHEDQFLRFYRFMKDEGLRKSVMEAISSISIPWVKVNYTDIDDIRENKVVQFFSPDGYLMCLSKSLLGSMRKTSQYSIYYHIIDNPDDDNFVTIFKEVDDCGFTVYHVVRYLKIIKKVTTA